MPDILVYALHYEGAINKNSLGAVSEGARLAGELGGEAHAILLGEGVPDDLAASLGAYGASKVLVAEGPEGLAQPVVDAMGQAIAAGDPVLMLYGSANRDERVFGPDAERFDIARDPNPHVSFGFGIHFCIGAVLARLEARVVLEEVLDRYAAITPAGPLERSPSPVIAGLRRAPLTFVAR